MPRPTVYDVAKRAGVSTATVSFAYRHPERVRDSTREAVLSAAHELGYVPSATARGLAQGRTGTFGMYSFDLMLPPPSDDNATDPNEYPLYVNEIQHGVEMECRQRGRALLINAGNSDSTAITDIAGHVDGLAILPGPTDPEDYKLVARRIPVVAFGLPSEADYLHHIGADNRDGIRQLVEHLYYVHGIRDFQMVNPLTSHEFRERFSGFGEALESLGLTPPTQPCDKTDLATGPQYIELTNLIVRNRLPQAVVCASDQHALAVMRALAAHHVPVPERVAVTGFDGIIAGQLSRPTLTTARQPMAAMGRLAVQILTRHIDNNDGPRESHVMPVELIIRESCGCLARPDFEDFAKAR